MAKEELERKLRPTYDSDDTHVGAGDLERRLRPTYGTTVSDAGRGGHHGGGHHGGGGHRGGYGGGSRRLGGVDYVVVTRDCPPGFYFDDLGNCRPLPYHSQNVGELPADAGFDNVEGKAYRETYSIYNAGDAGDVPVGWFNPFDPFGSGYAANTNRERNALNDAIIQTDIRVTANSGKISSEVLADYISFRKDWAAVNTEAATVDQLNSMRARFRAELDRLAPFMKVDDLKPPPPVGKQVTSAIDAFTDSTKKAGDAAQIGIIGLLVIAAVVAYVAAPELLKLQGQAGAGLAGKLAK